MKTISYIFLIFILITSYQGHTQTDLKVEELPYTDNALEYNRDTLKAWIENILHGGGGLIDTASIKFKGNHQACGRFYQGLDVGFDKGLILSTGRVESAEPPNATGATSDEFYPFDPFSSHGDPDLLTMYNQLFSATGGKDTAIFYTGDAAVIEFIYQPYGEEIWLDYVFASEEYPSSRFQPTNDVDLTSWTGSGQVFDLMGISMEKFGFHNLAFADPTANPPEPEVQRWVTVQSINENSIYSSYFQPNPPLLGPNLGTEFDGLTKTVGNLGPLRVRKKEVTPCSKYNIKIAIEDFYWVSPNEDILPSGFQINSAVFLEAGSFKGYKDGAVNDQPGWTLDYEYTNSSMVGNLVENCNDIIATFTLERPATREYHIPFRIVLPAFRDNIEVSYEGGGVILDDTIRFYDTDTMKVIRLKAVNLTADIPNAEFRYPLNPCDITNPFGGGFSGSIEFNLRNNEPFGFTQNPKIYEAYCKETIELSITDVTQGGVTPLFYYWDGDVVSKEEIQYQVVSSPDYVPIIVKDNCGNEANPQVKINNKPIVLNSIADAFLCGPGQSVTIDVSASMPNYSDYSIDHVRWFKSNPPQPDEPLGEADGNQITVVYDDVVGAALWTCGFEVTDCCGGSIIGSFIVNQSELTLGDDLNICLGMSQTITANAVADSYAWYPVNDPTNILSTFASVTVTPSVTTEYELKILDLCGQWQTASITVIVDLFEPSIDLSPASMEICSGDTMILSANPALEYFWEPGGATTSSIILNPTDPGAYTYTLTASSAYCIDKQTSASFTVFEIPTNVFTYEPNEAICTGEEIQFTYGDDANGKAFSWDFGDGNNSTASDPKHIFAQANNYEVYLKVDQYICSDDTTVFIEVDPLPSPLFTADVDSACVPLEVVFTNLSSDVASGAVYEWSFGDGNTSSTAGSTSNEYSQAGLYTVSLSINNTDRCTATTTIPDMILVNANPEAAFEAEPWISTLDAPDIYFQDSTKSDDPVDIYLWDFADGNSSDEQNPTHTYTQPGTFDVTLTTTTNKGCVDVDSAQVVITLEIKLYFPNAFTPDGDGLNDVFEIKGTPISDFHLYIFDRWGSQIWSTHDFETKWDGNDLNGNPMASGTYIYKISGTDHNYKALSFSGTVSIVR